MRAGVCVCVYHIGFTRKCHRKTNIHVRTPVDVLVSPPTNAAHYNHFMNYVNVCVTNHTLSPALEWLYRATHIGRLGAIDFAPTVGGSVCFDLLFCHPFTAMVERWWSESLI